MKCVALRAVLSTKDVEHEIATSKGGTSLELELRHNESLTSDQQPASGLKISERFCTFSICSFVHRALPSLDLRICTDSFPMT